MPNLQLVPKPELADAPTRALALDTAQSFIVEAPAGSGKTALILQRFLKLLALVDAPDQVLAITFTRKATAELHDRILTQLQSAHDHTEPQNDLDRQTRPLAEAVLARDQALGWSLLDHPHRLNVRTIDSLAKDIAGGLPILSNSGGAQSPDPDPEPLYAEAAHRTLMQLGGPDHQLNRALETILLHRDGNLANVQTLITIMLAQRDQWGELIPLGSGMDDVFLDEQVLPKFERALDLAICRGLTALADTLPPDLLDQLAALGANIGHSPHCTGLSPTQQSADLDHWTALIDLLLTKGDTYRKALTKASFNVELDSAHKSELAQIIDRIRHDEPLCELLANVRALPPARYPPAQWLVAKSLFHVLSRALAELQLVFAARGSCDFAELGLLARAALRSDAALDDLRASSGMDLQHLLVDEMQDTSSSQYELIQLLTQRWDGAGQTVFLVGDPKQSIYLFRQARVERFVHTMHTGALGDLPLTPLHLTANFRSQQTLVEDFNHDFSRIFPLGRNPGAPSQSVSPIEVGRPLNPEQVPYYPATPVRPATSTGETWHTDIQPYDSDTEVAAALRRRNRRRTAAQIRPILTKILARPLPPNRTKPWSIAILVRNRIHLTEIVPALKGRKPATKLGAPGLASETWDGATSTPDGGRPDSSPIPYRAIEIEPLSERQEILDLISLTRALLHPADRTAWLALLRTPCCGLTLADLHLLSGGDDETLKEKTILQLMDDRGDLLSHDGIDRLELFYPTITQALAQRGRQPLAQWVHQTWLAFKSNLYSSEEELSSISRYLRLLDELEDANGNVSLPRLEQRLRYLYAAPSVHPGAVDLMTIHGAKGLEWDFVLVPGLERIGMNTNGRLLDWMETDPGDLESEDVAPGLVAPIRGKGGAIGKLNEWMRSLEKARSAAEVKRLYYVACTRAREELHLFATLEINAKSESKPKSGSLLAAAWAAAEEHFTALPAPNAFISTPTPTAGVPHSSQPDRYEWESEGLALAAVASPVRTIPRIPAPPFALTPTESRVPQVSLLRPGLERQQSRPQGNFLARTLGTATHALLEQLSLNPTPLEDLPTWTPRITTLLRASGLAPHEVQRHVPTILRALTSTLESETGRWILAPHPQSASESSLTSFADDDRTTIRIDRTFLAGPEPLTPGQTHLWIIDYKTADYGGAGGTSDPAGLEAFLAAQKETYRPQLEAYARQFTTHPIRLALFYPLLQRLLWWSPN